MISGFIRGFTSYFGALNFVFEHRLYKYFIISGLISLAIGSVIFSSIYFYSDDVGSYLLDYYPFEVGKDYLSNIITYATGGILAILGLLIFKYLLLIFISPFMGPLSAKVESIITQRTSEEKFSIKQLSYEAVRGIRLALRNISREIFYTLILLLLGLIPLLTIFVTPLLFMVQAYYVGFSNFDYFLERRTTIKESVAYNRSHRGQVIGNGSAFLLILFIPILGMVLAPILGTVAATKAALKNNDLPEIDYV